MYYIRRWGKILCCFTFKGYNDFDYRWKHEINGAFCYPYTEEMITEEMKEIAKKYDGKIFFKRIKK